MTFAPRTSVDAIIDLRDMLTTKRPAYSKTERIFIDQWLMTLPGAYQDTAKNIIVKITDDPIVLWSSHTDTVHRKPGKQKIVFNVKTGCYKLAHDSHSNCLGADCTTGVWIMREMILANRPGLYIFHAAEEIGGHGSMHIATKTPALLDGIKMAIAFDRKGFKSVITHQWDGRCCSDNFAVALGAAIGLGMEPDDGGSFTDTANYTSIVPECTNISVGYFNQHTNDEMQHVGFAEKLLEAMLTLDVSGLPIERIPEEDEYEDKSYDAWGWDYQADSKVKTFSGSPYRKQRSDLEQLVFDNPEAAADLLATLNITADDFEEFMG